MINPYLMSLREYADAVVLILGRYGSNAVLADDDWKRWAREICRGPRVAASSPPDPEHFEDWQHWAARFSDTLHGLMT